MVAHTIGELCHYQHTKVHVSTLQKISRSHFPFCCVCDIYLPWVIYESVISDVIFMTYFKSQNQLLLISHKAFITRSTTKETSHFNNMNILLKSSMLLSQQNNVFAHHCCSEWERHMLNIGGMMFGWIIVWNTKCADI